MIPGESVGGVRLGMPLSKAKALWGPPVGPCIRHLHETRECQWFADGRFTIDRRPAQMDVTAQYGRVTAISMFSGHVGAWHITTGPIAAFKTPERVHIGSPQAEVKKAYTQLDTTDPLNFGLVGVHAQTRFSISGGRVIAIFIHRKQTV